MKQNLKQFEGWATSLRHNVFLRARLKLAAMYVFIIALILAGFSIVLYQNIQKNLVDASEDTFSGPDAHQHFLHETLERTRDEILLIDLILLLVSAGAGYALADYTLKPIQKSVEAQRIFSENASHELRTPLAVMRNDAEVLLRNPDPNSDLVEQTLKSSIEEIDRMTRMAEDLLLIARSDNKKLDERERIDLSHVVSSTLNKMKTVADTKGILLSAKIQEKVFIRGNQRSIERVLINLVQNSINHTPVKGNISVDLCAEKKNVYVKIKDTGSGINEKDLPHIFERFYKGVGTSGNGLGLSIVKELVSHHDGKIDIRSKKGEGTEVALCFPQLS